MPPLGPTGDPAWTGVIEALLTPLFLLSACASMVWGLQTRYTDVVAVLRQLTHEYRDQGEPSRAAALAQLQMLVKRARLIRTAVVGFYLAILLQLFGAAWVGLLLLGWLRTTLPLILVFEANLVVLFVAVGGTLVDTFLSYHGALEEAREAGLLANDLADRQVRAARTANKTI